MRRLKLLTLLLAISLPSFALTFTVDGIKYETIYSTTDNEVKVSVQPSTISGDIIIPASVTYDGRNYTVTQIVEHAFYFCDMMTSLSIPGSINLIDEDAIVGCKSMTSINVAPDNQIYASVDGVLYNKNVTELLCCPRGKKSISIPESVTTIGGAGFKLSDMYSLIIPANVKKIKDYVFNGCEFKPLKILSKEAITLSNNALRGIYEGSEIACYSANYDRIKSLCKAPIYHVDIPDVRITEVTPYLCGVTFRPIIPYYEGSLDGISFVIRDIPIAIGSINTIKDLSVGGTFNLSVYCVSGVEKRECGRLTFSTKKPRDSSIHYACTQTTITLNSVDFESDMTCTPKVTIRGEEFTGSPVKLTGLKPNTTVKVWTEYPGCNMSNDTKTSDIYVRATSVGDVFPNQLEYEGIYNVGDAKLMKMEWVQNNNVISNSKRLALTGLAPEREYTVDFKVTVGYGESGTYSKSSTITVKTKPLELEMQLPKSVGNGKTIVSAKTNLSESEANVGFEWKKTDAPSTLPYSVGYSAIYDGHIEGLIQNLQNTYYNVRAFYKTADGKYYYTDIVSFDPTDFSFFEPTVHTYPAEPEENHATLRGYVLGGTDNILGQGFQYWIVPDGSQHAQRHQAPAADAGVMTVAAEGQRMAVVISDLKPGTTYAYRAYAETESGVKYGEEQTFVTPGSAGIEDIAVDETDVTVIGYYDLYGRRYDEPQRGLNIVLYSNGQTRKIIRK